MTDKDPSEADPPNGPPPEPPPEPPPASPSDKEAELDKWREMARKHEKENRALNKRIAEFEDRDKSELERAADQARSWQAKAEAAELRAMRTEVAARKGLTSSQAKWLQGGSEEELESNADEILAAFQPPDEGLPAADRRPEPRLRPGAVPDAGPVETDPRKLADQIRRSF